MVGKKLEGQKPGAEPDARGPQRARGWLAGVEIRPVRLPKPALKRSGSLAKALELRMTTREIGSKELSSQTLSNLLWAAGGVNRRKGPFGIPGRTAASASNSQEIDVYVALEAGCYHYDPVHHMLKPVTDSDLRRFVIGPGQKEAGAEAPVRLIYVADIDKLVHTAGYQEPGLQDPDIQRSYYFVDTGLIAANVYLFAASTGLAAWFHNCDKEQLSRELNLREDQRVLFGQTVGYPAKKH